MRRYLFLLFISILILSGCQDEICLNKLSKENRLVVYCLPTTSDTTRIYVSCSIPVTGESAKLESVKISSYVNGHAQKVTFNGEVGSGNRKQLEYYFVKGLRIGDKVGVHAEAENLTPVNAETVIPDSALCLSLHMNSLYSYGEPYDQIVLKVKNTPGIPDYFGVRVVGLANTYDGDRDTVYQHSEVEEIKTSTEPVLNNYTLGDLQFDESNTYWGNLYIFDSSSFLKDCDYTLHLNVRSSGYISAYRVELYHLTQEFYKFFKSLNESQNNKIGNYGMSFVLPSYTNFTNGAGVLGGYNVKSTIWIEKK